MKNIFFVIILLIPIAVSCQTTDTLNYKKSKFGFVFSPDYCYRILTYNTSYIPVEDLRRTEEVPAFGFTAGLNFRKGLTPKIIFVTGIYYSVMGAQTKNIELKWATPGINFPVTSKTRYLYKYLDIPVKINYLFGPGRVNYFISCGVSVNIFSEKKTKLISAYTSGHTTSVSSAVDLGFLKFNLATLIGLGIKYDITKRLSIACEPVYRQFINSIEADKSIKEHPYSIGINVEMIYRFKQKK
ncbi:MAG: outer membrane beta-barrel protein [Ferruginibacter sp.]